MPVNILLNMTISESPLKLYGSLIDPYLCIGQILLAPNIFDTPTNQRFYETKEGRWLRWHK